MPRTIEKTVYKFDELSDSAKERAREWYRELIFSDSCDLECICEDAKTIAKLFGLEIENIYFSGFGSQGDGACFEGTYAYKKGAAKAVREYAPQDAELHAIVGRLQDVQRRNFYRLTASCTHRGHYYHSGCMSVDIEERANRWRDIGDDGGELRDLLREFADWVYSRLKDEYYYQTSDEAVDESITINEYEFDEEGRRV